MASFAERVGKRAPRSITQTNDLDLETRTELWNVFVALRDIFEEAGRRSNWDNKTAKNFLTSVWAWEFKRPRDEMESQGQVWSLIKRTMLEAEWFDVLNLIEETAKYLKRYAERYTDTVHETLTEAFNNRFEHFLVGY